MSRNRELETEVIRALNSVPMTRAAKRDVKKALLKEMDQTAAMFFLRELKSATGALSSVLDTIGRSRKIRLP